LAAGVNMALGTDNVANNNSYDLFQDMRLLCKLTSFLERRPSALPARTAVDMATTGGAQALGLETEIGSLEAGKRADLIALDLSEIGWVPMAAQDIHTALVYAVTGMHVTDVMVDGQWLMQRGQITTIDYPRACLEVEDAFAALTSRRKAAAPRATVE
jgi:5-methylthioadenosine/S-adenosylhomocysteine deaminase